MKYFVLVPNDQRSFNWIFFNQPIDEPLNLREQYRQFQCPVCKKFDEKNALMSGIDSDVVIKSSDDYFLTNDGLICISQRLKDIISTEKIRGLNFIDIPFNKDFIIAIPEIFVETDVDKAKMQFEKPKCELCGRFSEVFTIPWSGAMILPKDPLVFFAPNVWIENRRNRVTWLFTSEIVVNILKKNKIKGITFQEA